MSLRENIGCGEPTPKVLWTSGGVEWRILGHGLPQEKHLAKNDRLLIVNRISD